MKITITEALAELKLERNKAEKKHQFVMGHLARSKDRIDPLEEQGGSTKVIAQELQAIKDLQDRMLRIRMAINEANMETVIEIAGETRTVAEWLVWRRDILPHRKAMLDNMVRKIQALRNELGYDSRRFQAAQPMTGEDLISHVDIMELAKDIEHLGEIEDRLDGLLSLRNAQVTIDI